MKHYFHLSLIVSFVSAISLSAEADSHDPACTSCQDHPTSTHNHGTEHTMNGASNRLAVIPSLVIDTFGYYQDSGPGAVHLSELAGFGHGHEEDEHEHSAAENGFNLRHIELSLYAKLDGTVDGRATLAVEEDDIEIEEAYITAHGLLANTTLSAGKVFSRFGLQNWQHSHAWHFWNRPLVYEAMFGDHGLNEVGLQLSWRPDSSPFSMGLEALQGENALSFAAVEADALSEKNGPRVWAGWIATDLEIGNNQSLRFKLSGATGYHQEAHDEDADDVLDHWFHGRSKLLGAGFEYRCFGKRGDGSGTVFLRGEYIYRRKFLELKEHLLSPGEVGNNLETEQDGYYLQAQYGVTPKWRIGLRWDEVGIKNINHLPDGSTESFGPSRRISGTIERVIGHGSLVRLQIANGDYELEDEHEKNWEFIVQWQVTFGGHSQ